MKFRFCAISRSRLSALAGIAGSILLAASSFGQEQTNILHLGLRDAIDSALLNNRDLQIEKIEPAIARARLRAAYGIYDPVFESTLQKQSDAESGGLDPANFDATSAYNADSKQANLGLSGYLPTGLRYNISGRYAHSEGVRNFLNFDSYSVESAIGLEQPLLRDFWIDGPRYIIKVNKGNLKMTELGVQYVAMTVINATQQAYYDLVFAWERLKRLQDLSQSRNNFLRIIRRQVELGYRTVLEDRVAQANAAAIATDLVQATNDIALASNQLKTLMGLTESNWTQAYYRPSEPLVMMPEKFNLMASWGAGLKQRPDLLQLGINLQNAEYALKYRRNQLFPFVNLLGSYKLSGSDSLQAFPPDTPRASETAAFRQLANQNAPSSMIGILFSVPLSRTTERARFRETKELREQAKLLLKQKEELVMREISDAVETARSSYQGAELAREASIAADLALRAEEQRLEGGTGNVIFVLQAQDFIVENRVSELEFRRDYNKALSELHFREGTLLEKNHIQFDF